MPRAAKEKHVIVSGIQPTGVSHVGNYAGAYRNWLNLQGDKNAAFFFIADYHSLTADYEPSRKRQQVLDLATDLLALGLDPDKCTLFVQSDVPEHTELCWIFNTVTPVSFLERMTQYKDKASRQEHNVNMGLFDYPVLQAADILMYKGDRVPVGRDQVQHVELTRDIARFFNNKYGRLFPETEPLLTDTPKIKSLTDPLKKMSKSMGEKTFIALTDSPEQIAEKMKRAVTETTGVVSLSEKELEHRLALHDDAHKNEADLRGMAGVWNLITMLRIFGSAEEADHVFAQQPIKYADLKKLVAARVSDHFSAFRAARAKLAKDPGEVWAIMAEGAKRARAVARRTMEDVRARVGLR
jgi:tryptophanyl-tRNA synthetase